MWPEVSIKTASYLGKGFAYLEMPLRLKERVTMKTTILAVLLSISSARAQEIDQYQFIPENGLMKFSGVVGFEYEDGSTRGGRLEFTSGPNVTPHDQSTPLSPSTHLHMAKQLEAISVEARRHSGEGKEILAGLEEGMRRLMYEREILRRAAKHEEPLKDADIPSRIAGKVEIPRGDNSTLLCLFEQSGVELKRRIYDSGRFITYSMNFEAPCANEGVTIALQWTWNVSRDNSDSVDVFSDFIHREIRLSASDSVDGKNLEEALVSEAGYYGVLNKGRPLFLRSPLIEGERQ